MFWKEYSKQFKLRDTDTKRIEILINEKKELVLDDADKAELFYDSFFSGNHLKDCQFDENHKEEINKVVQDMLMDNTFHEISDEDELNRQFEMVELNRAVEKLQHQANVLTRTTFTLSTSRTVVRNSENGYFT